MPKEELLEFPGVVTELSANATFRVKLDNEHEIVAPTAGRVRKKSDTCSCGRQGSGRDDAS